jgi:hypothetical protein
MVCCTCRLAKNTVEKAMWHWAWSPRHRLSLLQITEERKVDDFRQTGTGKRATGVKSRSSEKSLLLSVLTDGSHRD